MPFLTDSQKAKIQSANQALFSDPEFANVADLLVTATEVVPTIPVAETEQVEVKPALPA